MDLTLSSLTTLPSSMYFTVNTSGYGYIETGVNLIARNSFVFQVKSVQTPQIALITTPGDFMSKMFEILLVSSVGSNQCSVRNQTLAHTIAYIMCNDLHDQMNGIQWVWIWMSWANEMFTMGSGKIVGQNIFLMYPNVSEIANVSTVAVSSYATYKAQWMIPLAQNSVADSAINLNVGSTAVYNSVFCQNNVTFAGSSNEVPFVILTGRTSITFEVETYGSLIEAVFITAIDNFNYSLQVTLVTPVPNIALYRNGSIEATYYSSTTPPMSESPGLYWISWNNGLVLVGIGSVIGTGSLLLYNDSDPGEIIDMLMTFTGTLTVPFGYFVGPSALSRNNNLPMIEVIKMQLIASNACVTGCAIEIVDNPTCAKTYCSSVCASNVQCTTFCLQQPRSPGNPCTCQLQAKPGTPSSMYLYQSESGASYWEMFP